MPVDKKAFEKDIKRICGVFGKNKTFRKRCMDATMCQYHKCNPELDAYRSSMLTKDEREECDKSKNYFKCVMDKAKEKGTHDKHAMLNHCIANKCPEDLQFTIEFNKKIHEEFSKRNECKPCQTLLEESDKANIDSIIQTNECNKKHTTAKDQEKCIKKYSKKMYAKIGAFHKCKVIHCPVKSSKHNQSNKNTKKTSKSSK